MRVVAASSKVAPAAEQVQAHEAEAQGESLQQIWVRAVGNHDSRSVMVSLKAPTGDTELNGLGFGRFYSPQMGTLDPEKSFAAQGISKGATLSLLPRLIIGGVGGSPEGEKQETQRDSTVGGEPSSIEDIQIASAQAMLHVPLAPSPISALTHISDPHLHAPTLIPIPPVARSWRCVGRAGGGRFATHRASSPR